MSEQTHPREHTASNSKSTQALMLLKEDQHHLLQQALAAGKLLEYSQWRETPEIRSLTNAPVGTRRAITVFLASTEAIKAGRNARRILRELLRQEDALDGSSALELLKTLVIFDIEMTSAFVNHLTRLHKNGELAAKDDELKGYLERNARIWREDRETQTLGRSVTQLLSNTQGLALPLDAWNGSWVEQLQADFQGLPETEQSIWTSLINHGMAGSGSSPSNARLKAAAKLASSLPIDALSRTLARWLGIIDEHKDFPGEVNEPFIKALIWTAGIGDPRLLAPLLGDLAINFYTKVHMVGPRSRILGNACIQILCLLDKPGVVQLSRLRSKIRYSQGKALIEKSVIKAAQHAGHTPDEMEEASVPQMGFDSEGVARFSFGEANVLLRLVGEARLLTEWYGADGKAVKSVPATVKRDHSEDFKEWQTDVKQFSAAISGQRARFEQAYLGQRSWSLSDWRERFIDSTELLGWMGRRLVWNIEAEGQSVAVIGLNGQLTNLASQIVDDLPDSARVTLWHPIQAPVAEVLAWRERLLQTETLQPIRQAFREIYVLTDAERDSGSVSQRFAGQLLKQFQLKALFQERGWSYTLQGTWDSHNTPCKKLHGLGLEIHFELNVPTAFAGLTGGGGVYAYVESGAFYFSNKDNRRVQLADIPPLVFSEVLRDMDLFVGVCSVANDPEQKLVDDPAFHRYISFADMILNGDFQGGMEVRRDLLDRILSRLPIARRCKLEGRYLVVEGDIRTYRIHLASSNILIQPDNRYLCIVRDTKSKPTASGISLPFEGDALLSLILSKALMLANDKKIKDPSILSQINAG